MLCGLLGLLVLTLLGFVSYSLLLLKDKRKNFMVVFSEFSPKEHLA